MGKFDGVLDEVYGKQNTKLTSVLDEIYGPSVKPVTMEENKPVTMAPSIHNFLDEATQPYSGENLVKGIDEPTKPILLFTAPPNQDIVVPEELDLGSMQAARDRQAMLPPSMPAEEGYVPPAGITEGLKAAFPIAYQATKKGISGAVQALAENAPVTSFPTAPIAEYMQGVGEGAQAEIEKTIQEKQIRPGTISGVATDVGATVLQFAPILGASIISPTLAPYGLGLLATISGGDKYQRAKEAGFTEEQALAQGIAYGIAEVVGEKIGLDALLNAYKNPALRQGIMGFIKETAKQAGIGAGEEGLTQIMQNSVDIAAKKFNPYTAGEAPALTQDVLYAAGVGGIGQGLIGGGLGALQSMMGGKQQAEAPIEKPVDTQMTEFLKKQNDTRDNVRTTADVEKQMQEAEALRKISDEYNQLIRDEAKGKPTGEEIKRQRAEQMKSQAGFAEETQIDDTEAVIREAQKAATQAQQADARQRKANVLEGLFGQQEPQPMEGGRSLPYPKNDVIQEIRDAGLKTKDEVVAFFSGRHNITREGASNLLKIAYNQPLPERTYKTPPSKPPVQPPTIDQLFTRKPAVTFGEAERLRGEEVPTGGMTINRQVRPTVIFGGEGERTGEAMPEGEGMTIQPTAPSNKLDQLFKREPSKTSPQPKKEYGYLMNARPFSIGAQPKGQVRIDENKGGRWGTIYYDRPLTNAEIKIFELEPVKTPPEVLAEYPDLKEEPRPKSGPGMFGGATVQNMYEEIAPKVKKGLDIFTKKAKEFIADEEGFYSPEELANAVKAVKDKFIGKIKRGQSTQVTNTINTYAKILDRIADKAQGKTGDVRVVDVSTGLGMSEELAKNLGYKKYETTEPFPAEGFVPTYKDSTQLPDNAFDFITNNQVLNVVPKEIRDGIVKDIGRALKEGGTAIISTRGKDVMAATTGRAGEEPMSLYIPAKDAQGKSYEQYQKGFTNAELKDYVQGLLGDGFDVKTAPFGAAGVEITKIAKPTKTSLFKGKDIGGNANLIKQEALKNVKTAIETEYSKYYEGDKSSGERGKATPDVREEVEEDLFAQPRPKSGPGMFEGAELQNEEIDWSAPFSRVIIDENDARFIERFKQKGIDINLAKISGSIEKMPKELLTKLAEGYDMGSNAVEALYRYVKGEQEPEIIKYFNDKGEEIQHNPNGWNEIILTITNDGHSISNAPQKGTKAREVIDKIIKEHYEKRELDIMQNIAGETTIGTLKDWLKGPDATEMFKDVLDTQVIIRPEGPTNTTLAWVPSDGKAIYLNSSQIKTVGIRYLKNAITHEAQHLLQIKKGQKIGGQNYLPYKERPAEIEAHAVGEKYRTGRLSMFGAGTLQNVYESVFGKPRQSNNRITIGDPKIGTKINDMYDRTEATRKNLDEQAEKKRPSTYATTKQSMIDVFMPYLDIVKNDSARYEQALSKLHDVFYIPSAVEGFLLDLRDEILTPVQKAGKTYRDYSAYRMAKWTLTGRAKVKSPLSLKEAQDFIDSIDAPTKKLFEDITTKFHERVWKNVLKEVESTGLKDDKTINFIMDKENYATFFPAKQMGLSYGSREYKPSGEIFKLTEEGYTGDIQDVLTSLTQKGIAMLTHANINAAKLEAFDILKTYSPNDITSAKQSMKGYTKIKDSNGNEIEIPIMEFDEPAPNSQMALLTARDKGKAVGYYVPKQFATSFDEALGSGEQLHDALRYFSNATQAIKNVWIDYNPPWQLFTNIVRDIPAAMIEMPGFKKPVKFAGKVIRNAPAAIGDYIPVIGKALQIMTGYDRAKFDAQVKKMLKEKKLLSSKDVQQLGDYNISVFDRIQNAFDTFPREGESKKFLQQVKAFGKDVERLVKTAFDETLVESQEFTDDEIVNMTRRGGSPAFAVRGGGKAFNVATTGLVFYNAVKEGWRAGKYFYEKDPVGFVIKASIPLSIFSFGVAAVSGAFGDEWKKAYLAIKKSDRENKLTFPLWWEPDGQIKYIALSMPQFLKPFMTAINEFGSADARILEGMADAFSNEMPSLNPVFDIAKTLALYGQNKPPIDRFGNPIMTQDQWTAGGPDKAINMLKAISNQNLFGSIYRFPIKPSETKKDLFSLTSLYDATFGKILKTSFAPAMDTEKEEANAAKARLLMREAIEIEKSDPVKYQKLRDEIRKLGVIPSRQFMRSVRRGLNIEREEEAGTITKREAYEKKLRSQPKEKRKKYNELFRK